MIVKLKVNMPSDAFMSVRSPGTSFRQAYARFNDYGGYFLTP